MTVRDLITRSMRFVHILGDGEDPTDTEGKDALQVLNELVDITQIDKLLAFFQTEIVFPFVGGKLSYTIGPTSTSPDVVVAARPVEILSGFTRRQNIDLPMFIGAKQDYDNIQTKSTVIIGGWETMVYYEAAYPKGTLFFYGVPADNASEAHLTISAMLSQFLTLDDEIVLPPGYNQWFRYTLAQHLAPEFGFTFTEEMKELQINSQALVKANNSKPMPISQSDAMGLTSRSPSGYNVYSDTTRSGR